MIEIVGGVYREFCMHPNWRELYGSAGRAASAVARLGGRVNLHCYLDSFNSETLNVQAALNNFTAIITKVEHCVSFEYQHGLSTPTIIARTIGCPPIHVKAENVIRFGMIEGDAIIDCEYAVYDPQDVKCPTRFDLNGSRARHLAIVLNKYEAMALTGSLDTNASVLAKQVQQVCNAEVVVLKLGARGALVLENNILTQIPAYKTSNVWKIGSGDTFVANFGYYWMEKRVSCVEAANLASKATAYYCENRGFPSQKQLDEFSPLEIQLSEKFLDGHKFKVYLAGPFFTLSQLWLIEEARQNLMDMGLEVFSPYHDVGHGSAEDVVGLDLQAIKDCDVMFAISDGLDSGTMYETGFARAIGKSVVVYSEIETKDNLKMMAGSECEMCSDYVTAIYKTLWTVIQA